MRLLSHQRPTVAAVLLLLTVVLASGCRTVPGTDADMDVQPWNTPAAWEGQGIGMPY